MEYGALFVFNVQWEEYITWVCLQTMNKNQDCIPWLINWVCLAESDTFGDHVMYAFFNEQHVGHAYMEHFRYFSKFK